MIEPGSDLAGELWSSAHPAVSSVLSYSEGRAALAAAQRHGRLEGAPHLEALATFESLQTRLTTLGVDMALACRAGQHAENLGLRGYDAVHIATALELDEKEVVMVTWDRDLAKAAERLGLGVAGLIA